MCAACPPLVAVPMTCPTAGFTADSCGNRQALAPPPGARTPAASQPGFPSVPLVHDMPVAGS